ncbi:sugar porter family MFS transporter [Asaia krungthepensis]|uniref:Major facilitator superfamily sugar transporter n=1 Tax=Asaia krungthepensis NRIC 0535 TaxID=1307925 RepID=A0ABQ0PZV7_9PROT|nr:sugar porter family MFS transporter [Asaia krungthepensis]GBQ85728.1 major facilitator superfamily sugar transporter [Asaia krungthepensis NRIC 0535]
MHPAASRKDNATAHSTPKPLDTKGRQRVFIASCVAGLAGILFGYDQGIISAALLTLGDSFPLGTLGKQAIAAGMVAGALLGCMGAGPLSDRWGRRPVVALAGALFLIGSIGSALAMSPAELTLTRVVLGLAVGGASQIVPVYIAELAPAARRGRLVLLFQLAIVGGVLLSSLIGWALSDDPLLIRLFSRGGDWRMMFLLGAIPALLLMIGMIFLPESPRFLASKGHAAEAIRILRSLRGPDEDPEAEMRDIQGATGETGSWRLLLSRRMRPALIAGTGLAMFSQITGTNAVLTYAPTILAGAGFDRNSALLISIAIGVTITIATVFGFWAVDHWGRRRLMLRVLPGSILALTVLAVVFLGGDPRGMGKFLAVGGLLVYVLCTLGSINASLWLVGAEVFPLSVRGKGMGLVTISHWSFDLLISLVTLSIISLIGVSGTFILFAGMTSLGWLFIRHYVPETRGRSLEAIERSLHEGDFLSHGRN